MKRTRKRERKWGNKMENLVIKKIPKEKSHNKGEEIVLSEVCDV